MIGIIPSATKTFEVYGYLKDDNPVEGKLYADSNGRLYYYSTIYKRSNPDVGYFPIWNGTHKFTSQFSNCKYLDKDVILSDLKYLSNHVDKVVADRILDEHRRSENDDVLLPDIQEGDNMFTQCIKGILTARRYTLIDLGDSCGGRFNTKTLKNYYSALIRITFMRLDKWRIWMDMILKVRYVLNVYKNGNIILTHNYPEDVYDTKLVNYDSIIKNKQDDSFKKIIKILMIMENITKLTLKSDETDDYTINNMMTTLNSNKPISAQLFSRFMRMADLNYDIMV